MSKINLTEIIAVYGIAFIILLILVAASLVILKKVKYGNKLEKASVSEISIQKPVKKTVYPLKDSGIPQRILPSSNIDINNSRKNSVIKNMELLSPLKRGILWAEILGKPGGRHRRNT